MGGLLLIRPHAPHVFAIGKATTCSVVSICRPDKLGLVDVLAALQPTHYLSYIGQNPPTAGADGT